MSDRKSTTTVFENENPQDFDLNCDSAPLLARSELWLLVSAGCVDPGNGKRLDALRDPAFRERVSRAAAMLREEYSPVELGPGEQDPDHILPERIFARFDAEQDTLEAAYRRLFGLTAISQGCPACEIEYESNPDVAYRSQRMADVAGFYRAFGLQLSAHAGERLDHLTVETEFLYLLLAREAAAIQTGNHEGAEVCRSARSEFFREHLGWWLPAFARLLERVAPSEYYRQLAKLAAGLSALERSSLGLPPFKTPSASKPSEMSPENDCGGCPSRQQTC